MITCSRRNVAGSRAVWGWGWDISVTKFVVLWGREHGGAKLKQPTYTVPKDCLHLYPLVYTPLPVWLVHRHCDTDDDSKAVSGHVGPLLWNQNSSIIWVLGRNRVSRRPGVAVNHAEHGWEHSKWFGIFFGRGNHFPVILCRFWANVGDPNGPTHQQKPCIWRSQTGVDKG